MSVLLSLLVGLLGGMVAGAYAWNTYLTKAPGVSVQLHQQALVRQWSDEPLWRQWKNLVTRRPTASLVPSEMELRDGPVWLSGMDMIYLAGVYDVSDKRVRVEVEPSYAPLSLPLPTSDPKFQRFYIHLAVTYRPFDMRQVLSLDGDIEDLIRSRAHNVVRTRAPATVWNPLGNGADYAAAVEAQLVPDLKERGVEVLQVFCERIGVRPPAFMESLEKGTRARNLGHEGLVLTYLEFLEAAAESENTIIIPAHLDGDPNGVLREALRLAAGEG